jgi:CheY-like chemotaxis protein
MALRCLIVDDNSHFREEVGGKLEEQGVEVVACVGSGADALEQAAQHRPDVALVDIDLHGESGFDVAQRLVELVDDGAFKVILISTHDECDFADLIEASPAIGFLAKTKLSATAIRGLLAAS